MGAQWWAGSPAGTCAQLNQRHHRTLRPTACRLEPSNGPASSSEGAPHGPDAGGECRQAAKTCCHRHATDRDPLAGSRAAAPPCCPQVLVLRLKTVGTVEERVVGVASDKAQLADRSITGARKGAALCLLARQRRACQLLHPTRHCHRRLPPPPGGFFDDHTSAEQRQRYLLDTIRAAQQQQVPRGSDQACGQLSDGQLNQLLARGPDELALFEAEDRRMQVGGARSRVVPLQPGAGVALTRWLAQQLAACAWARADARLCWPLMQCRRLSWPAGGRHRAWQQAAGWEVASTCRAGLRTRSAAWRRRRRWRRWCARPSSCCSPRQTQTRVRPAECSSVGRWHAHVRPPWLLLQLTPRRAAAPDAGKELGRGKRLRGTASYRDIGERAFVRLCQEGVEEGQAPAQLLAPASTASLLAAQATDPAAAAVKRRKLAPAEPVTATRPDDQLGPILTCSGPVPTAAHSVLGEDAPEAATGQLAAPRAHQPMTPPAERKCSHCGATSTSHWRRQERAVPPAGNADDVPPPPPPPHVLSSTSGHLMACPCSQTPWHSRTPVRPLRHPPAMAQQAARRRTGGGSPAH